MPADGSVTPAAPTPPASNFLRHAIEDDLARGAYAARLGIPHRATSGHNFAIDRAVFADPARVRTRFPPEPNGYLHIGHAKAICLNFGLARDYDGVCHLRFDDTNPEKEDVEYVDSIIEMVRWLGFDWGVRSYERELEGGDAQDHLYFASDYFDLLYDFAEYLIRTGHAYVDSQSADEIRAMRGTLVEPGRDSPYRDRSVDENLALFRMMRAGDFVDGLHVLRARIDMASPNINLRDPVLYRIRHAHHHRTGDTWRIYPMYDYTHCVSDALENITHSVCTLEFEDHRPLYDWALERIVPVLRAPQFMHAVDRVRRLREGSVDARDDFAARCRRLRHKLFASPEEARMRALFDRWDADDGLVSRDLDAFFDLLLDSPEQFAPLLTHALDLGNGQAGRDGAGLAIGAPNLFGLPHQYEFSRLNLTYVITSKRKLRQLVDERHVDGWDDPRMPTLVGLRRRGYTPSSIRLLCDRVGVSKSNGWTEYGELEQALRDDLDPIAPRAVAVLDPLRLVVTSYGAEAEDDCTAPVHPHRPERGQRRFAFTRELWIERDDFQAAPQKGFFRLVPPIGDKPGAMVRLKYGYVVRCTGFSTDDEGRVVEVTCEHLPETKSGTPGADAVKVKGTITWVSARHARRAEVRLYDRLFVEAQPDAGGRDFVASLNPDSKRIVTGYVEPGIDAKVDEPLQFERLGYFAIDRVDSTPDHPVFNRVATLRDNWQR